MLIEAFKEQVWDEGGRLFRPMPWREQTKPYYILVSELMLQQTQVDRVIPKFIAFIEAFPTVQALAVAPLARVLELWSGLGYNRRAKYLHEAAKVVVERFDGRIPGDAPSLVTLPGVGPNTAGAILAYGFNQPAVFIETNIRTVLFHHFFPDSLSVTDKELRELAERTVDHEHPREWYWAMMDYGTWLKKQGHGRLDTSAHYKKQAPLKGSLREIRGLILKALVAGPQTATALRHVVPQDDRFDRALAGLVSDSLVIDDGDTVRLVE